MRTNERLKQVLKIAIASLAQSTGILSRYSSKVLHNKAIILVYHRIIDDDSELTDYSSYGITVNKANFDKQIEFLSKNYNLIRLNELVNMIKAGENIPDKSCVITFDDGWRDNYTNAYPILNKYNAPATLFLTTNFIDNGEWFWEERIKFLLAHYFDSSTKNQLSEQVERTMKDSLGKYNIDLVSKNNNQLPDYLAKIVTIAKSKDSEWLESFLNEMESLKNLAGLEEPRRFMNWGEIQEIAAQQFDIGGHTLSHMSLPHCDKEKAERELTESKEIIDERLNQQTSLFAYPYGKTDKTIEQLTEKSGYKCGCTLIPGFNDNKTSLFTLKRIDIYQAIAPTTAFFECRMLQFLNKY